MVVASFLAVIFMLGQAVALQTEAVGTPPISALAARLRSDHTATTRDEHGRAVLVFGLAAEEARILLLPVGRGRPLPEGYRPPDLTRVGGQLVRALVVPDLHAMIDAAASEGVELAVVSGYRSPEDQAEAFESAVWRALARSSGEIDRAEAESRAARFVAPPGHSQHQLGTAIDFSSWEVGYAVQPRFAETAAGRWLDTNAWQYGFLLAYPRDAEPRTGYAYEPWHYRWVGRELAAVVQRDGYPRGSPHVLDDYLGAVEEILNVEGAP